MLFVFPNPRILPLSPEREIRNPQPKTHSYFAHLLGLPLSSSPGGWFSPFDSISLNLSPFGSVLPNPFVFNGDLKEGTESSGVSFLVPFLLFQGGAMHLSKVGGKSLSSVRCARSLSLLRSASDRPEVPAQAAAAAAVAYAIAGLPPHQRFSLSSSSEELSSIYGSRHHGQKVEEIVEEFYEELLL